MTFWLLKNKALEYEIIVVFANTGKEREETLQFINECDIRWSLSVVWIEAVTHFEKGKGVTARQVDFETASRHGEPFEAFIQKHGIPNQGAPKCTRELKAYAIRAYLRSIGWSKYYTAIGIRADEPRRINRNTAKKERLIYPFADLIRVTKYDVNSFWARQNFDLKLKSYEGNCDLCWKKSLRKLMTITAENPHLTDWWREMERKYGTLVPPASRNNPNIKLPLRFYRGYMAIDDIIAEAGMGFEPAPDESKNNDTCTQLDFFDDSIDGELGQCADTCEPFN